MASHLARYVNTFNLNVITSSHIQHTEYDMVSNRWTVLFKSMSVGRKVICKQLVLATGVGSQQPYVPRIEQSEQYQGLSFHSSSFTNAKGLKSLEISVSSNIVLLVVKI